MNEVFDLESQNLHPSRGTEGGSNVGGSLRGPDDRSKKSRSLNNSVLPDDNSRDQAMPDEPLYSSAEIADAWEKCHGFMKDRDIAMCKAWREEIKQLLIFAGLFSATVTAFIIESYRWLQPESNDVTAQYLGFLTAQFAQAQNVTLPRTLARLNNPPDVTASAIRINIFWFLSLIFNLSAVLVGILGYQWLREFQEEAPHLSHKEAIAFRQMKFQGLQSWHVPAIISSLPVLLQLALVLFFGGILDLLWHRNHIVAAVVTVAVGAVILFLAITTAAPALHYVCYRIRLIHYLTQGLVGQCPFKSTQSWLILQFTLWVRRATRRIVSFAKKEEDKSHADFFDWITYDLHWQRFDPFKKSQEKQAIRDAIDRMHGTWSRYGDVHESLDRCLGDLDINDAEALVRKLLRRDRRKTLTEAMDKCLPAFRGTRKHHPIVSICFLASHIRYHPVLQPRWVEMFLKTYGSDPGACQSPWLWSEFLAVISQMKPDSAIMIRAIDCLCVLCDEYPDIVKDSQLLHAWHILRTLSWNSGDTRAAVYTDTSLEDLDEDHFRFTCRVSKTFQTVLQSKMDEAFLRRCASGLLRFWPLEQGERDVLKLSRTFPEFMNIVSLVKFLEANEEDGRWSPYQYDTEDWHRLTSNFEQFKVDQDSDVDEVVGATDGGETGEGQDYVLVVTPE